MLFADLSRSDPLLDADLMYPVIQEFHLLALDSTQLFFVKLLKLDFLHKEDPRFYCYQSLDQHHDTPFDIFFARLSVMIFPSMIVYKDGKDFSMLEEVHSHLGFEVIEIDRTRDTFVFELRVHASSTLRQLNRL